MHLATPMSLNDDFWKPWFVSNHPFIHLLYACQNEFAFIVQKGRNSIQPSFIASSFMTTLSVNCLYRVYPSPSGALGATFVRVDHNERVGTSYNYNLIYYRNRFMDKWLWIIVKLESNKLTRTCVVILFRLVHVNIRKDALILQDIAMLWCFVQWFFQCSHLIH